MQEYLSEAVVLEKQPNGDMDGRFYIFTKKYGKLSAKAKSARKITSKLSGHLEPGSVARIRLVEKNGLQVADALKNSKIQLNFLDLRRLNYLLAESEPEQKLWNLLLSGGFYWARALEILGWNPREARCSACGGGRPAVFNMENQEFFCENCSSNLAQDKVIYIGDNRETG